VCLVQKGDREGFMHDVLKQLGTLGLVPVVKIDNAPDARANSGSPWGL